MSAAESLPAPAKAKRAKRLPIYLLASKMLDPVTRQPRMAFVAANQTDRMLCTERGYKAGDILRADITKARNPEFNRLVHGLGTLVRRHIDGYQDCADAHEVVKRLQREADVYCEWQDIDASPVVQAVLAAAESILGAAVMRMLAAVLPEIKTIRVRVARSLSFDSMDEAEFQAFWRSICTHLIDRYWRGLDENAIEHMIDVMPGAA